MVHTAPMKTPPSPVEAPGRIRLTISVTPEVHETFSKLAKASGLSLSSTMGEWLGDTIEAAEFTAQKVAQARAAPKIVMREMHAYALGLADETGDLLNRVRAQGKNRPESASAAGSPPSSNTGGKVPGTGARQGRRRP